MNKRQFDMLLYIADNNIVDLDEAAQKLFLSKDILQTLCDELNEAGFIQNYKLTQKGITYLENHKVDNAIILAAGMSTRFMPLNFEKPKGLLEVNGETLIERQINQLREKGIDEIIVVVGYMKEQFEFLVDKYNVTLVSTDDYAAKNNHASVYAARKYLKNTIITSCDLYFSENIFQKYAFDAYYCTIYVPGKTAERGIITDSDDKIIKTMYGDKCCDIWVTLGYAFFNKRFSDNFISILNGTFNLPETANKFWADIQDENLDLLYMYAKRYTILIR